MPTRRTVVALVIFFLVMAVLMYLAWTAEETDSSATILRASGRMACIGSGAIV